MISRLLICFCSIAVFFAADAHPATPLFGSHAVLDLAIPVDFSSLCRPRETPDCDYTPTVLEFRDEQGQAQSLPIEIIIRGGWRSLAKNCSAPLLFIRFNEQDVTGTVFEGQSLLPLTTHCGRGLSIQNAQVRQRPSTWEQYLLKEYLAHRLYNVITSLSLNARLVRMTYPNPDKPSRSIVNYAFFTEHFESVAERNSDELVERGNFDPEKLDADSAGLLALFQFMIGNTDWSVTRERNIILLQDSEGLQRPLPYDFDMSGLVDAHYAGPAPGLPIDDVQDRYFLGYCHPETDWDALFGWYLEREEALLSLSREIPALDRKNIKAVDRFLGKFFDTLHSSSLRDENIVNSCMPWPPSVVDHTTPSEMR